MKRIFLIPALLILLATSLKADLVTPGEVDRRFTIVNLEDFPDYEFYYLNPTYYYDHGYQQGPTQEVVFKQEEDFSCGRIGDKSYLYARSKSDSTQLFQSTTLVGGGETLSDYDVEYILDEIEIISVSEGKVTFKITSTSYVYSDGTSKTISKGMIGGGLWYLLFAGVASLGLIVFFVMRRKGAQQA